MIDNFGYCFRMTTCSTYMYIDFPIADTNTKMLNLNFNKTEESSFRILCLGSHSDDIEIGCGGTIIKHVQKGFKVGIIDLTMGELGTRGTADIRRQEAEESTKILGVQFRENMGFKDGFFSNDEDNKIKLVKKIREYRPDIVITNAPSDRHPDHGRSSSLTVDACFLSGLEKINTSQDVWRPQHIYHYIQNLKMDNTKLLL